MCNILKILIIYVIYGIFIGIFISVIKKYTGLENNFIKGMIVVFLIMMFNFVYNWLFYNE